MFAITSIPYGILSAFSTNFMPVVLRDAKISVGDIGWFSFAAWVPMFAQFLYAPLIDLRPHRRAWLFSAALLGAVSIISALWLPLPKYKALFLICTFVSLLAATVMGICNGGLMATLIEPQDQARTSGWYSAGLLGGMALGTWVLLSGFGKISLVLLSVYTGLLLLLPALFIFLLPTSSKESERTPKNLKETFGDLWKAFRSHLGWSGLLLCGTPVGTVALTAGGFASIAKDFQASHQMIAFVNGTMNAIVVAVGALVAGHLPRNLDRRKLYVLVGILTLVVDLIMAFSPIGPKSYAIGVVASFFISGLASGFFYTIVLETIKQAGGAISTYYTIFASAGNFAIVYVTLINTRFYDYRKIPAYFQGPRALLLSDAILNMTGVVVFSLIVYTLFRKRRKTSKEQASVLTSSTNSEVTQSGPFLPE